MTGALHVASRCHPLGLRLLPAYRANQQSRVSLNTWLAVGVVLLVAAFAMSCSQRQLVSEDQSDFNGFVLEVADALVLQDVERLVRQMGRTTLTCEGRVQEEATLCEGLPEGTVVEGFDVKFFQEGDIRTLDGADMRLLLEGMIFGADPQAPPDDVGNPGLRVYSTLFPDELVWFTEDENGVPPRGDIAITYIGRSPGQDSDVKRRLWAALAEESGGFWKIRLWLVGFDPEGHPALNPSEENGFQVWQP